MNMNDFAKGFNEALRLYSWEDNAKIKRVGFPGVPLSSVLLAVEEEPLTKQPETGAGGKDKETPITGAGDQGHPVIEDGHPKKSHHKGQY